MNKKKLFLSIFVVILVTTVVFLLIPKRVKKSVVYSDTALDKLRAQIYKDTTKKNIDTEVYIPSLDFICGLYNESGICYFNTAIQLLFADRNFILFILFQKFNLKQNVSLIMQKICFKLLTNEKVNINSELILLAQNENLKRYLNIQDGGDPTYVIDRILKTINSECFNVCTKGAPANFFIKKKTKFLCKCTTYNIQKERFTFLNVGFGDDLIYVLKNYFKKKNENIIYKPLECKKCKKSSNYNAKIDYYFPSNLFIEIGRIKSKHKELEYKKGEIQIREKIILNNNTYFLYGVVCLHKLNDGLHVNVVVKKGKNWYYINDSNIEKIDFAEKLPHSHSWILAYKKIGCINDSLAENVKKLF
ncbi:hypothetical protein COBT_000070 [Conglomerata obtusa]